SIPEVPLRKDEALSNDVEISVSSSLNIREIPFNGEWLALNESAAQMLPLSAGNVPEITIKVNSLEATSLTTQLRVSSKQSKYTRDITLSTRKIELKKGEQTLVFTSEGILPESQYASITILINEKVRVKSSQD